jgi:hypothetical protein
VITRMIGYAVPVRAFCRAFSSRTAMLRVHGRFRRPDLDRSISGPLLILVARSRSVPSRPLRDCRNAETSQVLHAVCWPGWRDLRAGKVLDAGFSWWPTAPMIQVHAHLAFAVGRDHAVAGVVGPGPAARVPAPGGHCSEFPGGLGFSPIRRANVALGA